IGRNNKKMTRATPTILNVAYSRKFFWDGRARSLEEQAVGPIKSAIEMNQSMEILVDELNSIIGYRKMFEKAYPGEGITEATIGKALATFERTIVSRFDAPFDRWLKGDQKAMSKSAQNGFKLFDGKARCSVCHSGPNFTDGSFHNIGLNNGSDIGRFEFVKVASLKGAFKTPTLRNVSNTAPYMHNGELKTMEDVIDHYIDGGKGKANVSPDMKAIKLSKQEKADLIEFLNALSETGTPVTFPILPK
ncbi:cytochrome-c peroxidase, partial [Kaarinaea lacus]